MKKYLTKSNLIRLALVSIIVILFSISLFKNINNYKTIESYKDSMFIYKGIIQQLPAGTMMTSPERSIQFLRDYEKETGKRVYER